MSKQEKGIQISFTQDIKAKLKIDLQTVLQQNLEENQRACEARHSVSSIFSLIMVVEMLWLNLKALAKIWLKNGFLHLIGEVPQPWKYLLPKGQRKGRREIYQYIQGGAPKPSFNFSLSKADLVRRSYGLPHHYHLTTNPVLRVLIPSVLLNHDQNGCSKAWPSTGSALGSCMVVALTSSIIESRIW